MSPGQHEGLTFQGKMSSQFHLRQPDSKRWGRPYMLTCLHVAILSPTRVMLFPASRSSRRANWVSVWRRGRTEVKYMHLFCFGLPYCCVRVCASVCLLERKWCCVCVCTLPLSGRTGSTLCSCLTPKTGFALISANAIAQHPLSSTVLQCSPQTCPLQRRNLAASAPELRQRSSEIVTESHSSYRLLASHFSELGS